MIFLAMRNYPLGITEEGSMKPVPGAFLQNLDELINFMEPIVKILLFPAGEGAHQQVIGHRELAEDAGVRKAMACRFIRTRAFEKGNHSVKGGKDLLFQVQCFEFDLLPFSGSQSVSESASKPDPDTDPDPEYSVNLSLMGYRKTEKVCFTYEPIFDI
jgi:hypothetical protein